MLLKKIFFSCQLLEIHPNDPLDVREIHYHRLILQIMTPHSVIVLICYIALVRTELIVKS